MITKNTYEELGQLISKNVGGIDATGASGLQTVDYNYNIRGWLKNINDVENIGNDLFSFKINYNDYQSLGSNDLQPEALYNGNISATYWKTKYGSLKKYNYEYDNLNRLTEAVYLKPDLSINDINAYNETLSYDKNGNIQTLNRNGGINAGLPNPIDDLAYTYDTNNKNLLVKVADASTSPQGFKNGNNTGNDYEYDANGNMTIDNNKGIRKIVYNHLNLPTEITFVGTDKISYIYNATGQKVVKVVTENSTITKTHYLAGGFQYKNSVLQFFPQAEGYVNVIDDKYNYVFNYTDHLGNIRLSYGVDPSTQTLKVLEENHYYPFGLKHEGYNMDYKMYQKIQSGAIAIRLAAPLQPNYKYKYNGKELQTELGLNMYDMDMRDYDPAIARWVVQDPVVHYDYSPYNAFDNNPVIFADPSGADAYEDKEGYNFTGADAQNFFSQLQGQLGETSSDSSPENDITVNSKGKITNIVINDKPHRIFDTDGNQLYVNDYAYDSKWLDLASVDEQLYVIIDNPFLVKLILKAGFVNSGFNMSQRYLETALNSHGSADFGFNQLRDELDMHNTEYDGYEDGNGAFFRVQGQKSIYNFADFSQFVWGSWMRVNNFSSLEMKAGAHINNFITTLISTDRTGGFIDSEADQRAIQNGFNYTNNLLSK